VRLLILGGDGMLGHQLFSFLRCSHKVRCTLRKDFDSYKSFNIFDNNSSYTGIDVRCIDRLIEILSEFHPDAVINCVGIIKQRASAKESIPSLEINALLPHRLAILCKAMDVRFLHFSTDCVFSGKKGCYSEDDLSDAEDLYGKTKFLGEVQDSNCLTLRTSIIGYELSRKKGLLEWFLSQSNGVRGFKNAIFSGLTTLEMSRIIEMMLIEYPHASGVYQVSSDPINKYELLRLFSKKLNHPIEIYSDEEFCCDRSLDSSRFRREFCYEPPAWDAMIEELKR
jgi:dTDP-4-dehydrorhamnose reductase